MRGRAGLTILAAALLAAATARATDPPRPQTIDRGGDLGTYTLAENARGDRLVVAGRNPSPDPAGVDVITAPAGVPFSRATRLRGNAVPTYPVSAALAADGTAAIVGAPQLSSNPDSTRLEATVRPPGGSFGKPTAISAPGFYEASVAFDRSGTAMAIWTRDSATSDASWVEESTRPPGGDWSKPTLISYERRGAAAPQVARRGPSRARRSSRIRASTQRRPRSRSTPPVRARSPGS